MDSAPRRWVLKPLSPLLQPSDLRTIAGPTPAPAGDRFCDAAAVVVRQVTVSSDDEWSPASSPASSAGSHSGFYSFVDDPESPQAELNQAWMASPRRRVQLSTLRQEDGFRLQSYGGGQTPGSLFLTDHDSLYRADSDLHPVREDEEKQLREEIIRNQAPKKTTTNSLLDLDLSRSMSYGPVRASLGLPAAAVNEDQINFGAVRQQFLEMERDHLVRRLNSPLKSSRTLAPKRGPRTDPDSGLERVIDGVSSAGTDETPIEREIRLVQEREETLRRSRGIRTSDGRAEMVQIQTKRSSLNPLRNLVREGSWFESEVAPSMCCPHRHPEEQDQDQSRDQVQYTRRVQEGFLPGPWSWREALQSRGPGSGLDFVEKEVVEVLRREQELQDQRDSRGGGRTQDLADQKALQQVHPKPDTVIPSPFAPSSASSSSSSSSSAVHLSRPAVRGLTETLMKDFEERRVKILLEENSYAGIQLVDDINNEVVESTRVTRHKNKRALQWEAGEINVQDRDV